MDWIHIALMIVLSALKGGIKNPVKVAHLEADANEVRDLIDQLWPRPTPAPTDAAQ
jgi:hypothetical protein